MNNKLLLLFSVFLFFLSCVSLEQKSLFDAPADQIKPQGIGNFYALNIYDDNITSEIWFSENQKCLDVSVAKDVYYSGNSSLLLKWNKNADNCGWTGIGFGWDGWAPKDLSQIIDVAAIQLKVKSVKGPLGGLPLAAALEDYSGEQAWLGFSRNTIQGMITDTAWTTVILPLSQFDWNKDQASPFNIKQFVIQFESQGAIYVDEIKIVPYTGGFYTRYITNIFDNASIVIDGKDDEAIWNDIKPAEFNNSTVKMIADNDNIFFLVKVEDNTPLENNQINENIWNGDAFEVAFSTDYTITPHRVRYRSTDRHIGISICDNPKLWDWTNNRTIKNAEYKIIRTSTGYTLEMKIPYSEIDAPAFNADKIYGVEFAVDAGSNGKRDMQYRWNSPNTEGFNQAPNLWAELMFETKK